MNELRGRVIDRCVAAWHVHDGGAGAGALRDADGVVGVRLSVGGAVVYVYNWGDELSATGELPGHVRREIVDQCA
ncbi:MAG: hypothetical protein M3Y17_13415 [Actinomycetota bacterium]|nr:hypothetical protein [Actinomycetota bacterium]